MEIAETARQVLALAKPSQKPVLVLLYAGYTQAEAAEHLGISTRAVEGRMYQLRKIVMLSVAAGKISPPAGFTQSHLLPKARGPVMI